MEISELYNIFQSHPVITTDTRNIPANSIFFALKGEKFNGNTFAQEALNKGAAYSVIDEARFATDNRHIVVDNVLTKLQQLARHHRDRLGMPIIAITGTNGKTTTKELISNILAKKYTISATKGNLNNHIGVPLTLLAMTKETELGIVEMGANHQGEINTLCNIANPDFGIITNIGKAHLEGFGTFEAVIKTKAELYDYIRNKGGKCFINIDNQILTEQATNIETISYGATAKCFMEGEIAGNQGFLTIKALFPKGWLYLKSKLVGNYNFENILAAACVGKYFDVDPLKIQQAVEEYTPSNNRSQLIQREKNTIIMDAYNANPTSMTAALNNFAEIRHENKCVILGDMLELGKSSAEEHQKIADLVESFNLQEIILVGPQFKNTKSSIKQKKFDNVELLSNHLKSKSIENKLILIKGSRGIHLENIIDLIH